MYKVIVEKECGCFRKREESNTKTFESKDEALIEAKRWAEDMNETFCKKHDFQVEEHADEFIIKVAMK